MSDLGLCWITKFIRLMWFVTNGTFELTERK